MQLLTMVDQRSMAGSVLTAVDFCEIHHAM